MKITLSDIDPSRYTRVFHDNLVSFSKQVFDCDDIKIYLPFYAARNITKFSHVDTKREIKGTEMPQFILNGTPMAAVYKGNDIVVVPRNEKAE